LQHIRLTGQKLGISQPQQLFLFAMQVEIFIDALHNPGLQTGELLSAISI
jgi:hypothetical protein